MKPWITTYTGVKLNPLDLKPQDIRIEDIIHSLACSNRFCGHTSIPINIAHHSVYVAKLCKPYGHVAEFQGLLHDASEYILGDVTKWLKLTDDMKAYREAEERAQTVIFKYFGLPEKLDTAVEWADRLMVRYEAMRMFPYYILDGIEGYEKPNETEIQLIGEWNPTDWITSKVLFSGRFAALIAANSATIAPTLPYGGWGIPR